jgi:uncharacterized membrane protein
LIVKSGLNLGTNPADGAAISTGTGLSLWYMAHLLPVVRREFRLGAGAWWLAASEALMGGAIFFLFAALAGGDVPLVAPIVAAQPLFVFPFSALFLKNVERLDRSTIMAGTVVVVGMVLVSA